jgi:hypothetical protein
VIRVLTYRSVTVPGRRRIESVSDKIRSCRVPGSVPSGRVSNQGLHVASSVDRASPQRPTSNDGSRTTARARARARAGRARSPSRSRIRILYYHVLYPPDRTRYTLYNTGFNKNGSIRMRGSFRSVRGCSTVAGSRRGADARRTDRTYVIRSCTVSSNRSSVESHHSLCAADRVRADRAVDSGARSAVVGASHSRTLHERAHSWKQL